MADQDAAALGAAAVAGLEDSAGELQGMWIGVSDPDKAVHLGAYGQAVVDADAAMIDDKGRIASITKTFTAAAVLQQVAAGTLTLDDTVADGLPELAAEGPDIADLTVEHLPSMNSGIPEFEFRVVNEVLADPTEVVDLHGVTMSTVDDLGRWAAAGFGNALLLAELAAQRLDAAHQPDTGAVFVALVNKSGSLFATAGPASTAFPDITGIHGLG